MASPQDATGGVFKKKEQKLLGWQTVREKVGEWGGECAVNRK